MSQATAAVKKDSQAEHHEEISFLVKNSTLQIIPNAGHLPTLENPKATNGILKEWLM